MAGPAGTDRLANDLAGLGLPARHDVLVHCSMRAIGPLDNGAQTLLDAVRRVIGPTATVVVPAQTPNNSTTSSAFTSAVRGFDTAEREQFVALMPGFRADRTPSYGVGVFAEYVRRAPQAVRSRHPQTSFAALGPRAAELTRIHALDSHLGDESPLAALYHDDAWVLLVGVDYRVCTAFHLAEYRNPDARRRSYRCFVEDNGERRQLVFDAIDLSDHDFAAIGGAFEAEFAVASGRVGQAPARAFPMRRAVDFAIRWMSKHRWSYRV